MMVELFVLALSATLCSVTANSKQPSNLKISTCNRDCDLEDYDCIRGHFCLNENCKVRDNDAEAPDRFIVRRIQYEAPYYDFSVVDYSMTITGLDHCKIVEYCYNATSGNQVISISCPLLSFKPNRTVIKLHRQSMEDKIYNFKCSKNYTNIVMTTILYKRWGWDLCTSHTSAYVPKLQPKHEVYTTDADVRDLAKSIVYPTGVLEKELFQRKSYLLVRKYINSVFCDFGCN